MIHTELNSEIKCYCHVFIKASFIEIKIKTDGVGKNKGRSLYLFVYSTAVLMNNG